MRTIIAVLMILHGIAHLPGFIVPWRLAEFKETPYRTTLGSGRIDVGDTGIRVVGTLWLIVAVVFVAVGIAMIGDGGRWPFVAVAAALASLVLSLLSLPEARIGVVVNLVILGLLAVSGAME